ncbi:MAG: signal peptidase I [Gammaproteobacteria bacterium]|nr:MAG: signal peptidase I [Gammaproteobacteria bacterium]
MLLFFSVLFGIFWFLENFVWARRKLADYQATEAAKKEPKTKKDFYSKNWLVDTCRSLFPVIIVVFALRSFVAEPFKIPSGSMNPLLIEGDFILVNKFSYGLKIPVWNKTAVEIGKPQRGDVIVFRFPKEPSAGFFKHPELEDYYKSQYEEGGRYARHFNTNFIKRVAALPGDKIKYTGKNIYINGKKLSYKYIEALNSDDLNKSLELWEEDMGNMKHQFQIESGLDKIENSYKFGGANPLFFREGSGANPLFFREGIVVPEGHYFVLGDNRDQSKDSRFWGFVPEENIVGKAFFIWMNFSDFGRIGNTIK